MQPKLSLLLTPCLLHGKADALHGPAHRQKMSVGGVPHKNDCQLLRLLPPVTL